jgi:hypothetical protein
MWCRVTCRPHGAKIPGTLGNEPRIIQITMRGNRTANKNRR